MAQCSEAANVSSAFNGEPKKRNVAVITGITGQVTSLIHNAASCCSGEITERKVTEGLPRVVQQQLRRVEQYARYSVGTEANLKGN